MRSVKCGGRMVNQWQHQENGIPEHYAEGRKCEECGKTLSIYNGKNICNACWIQIHVSWIDDEIKAIIEGLILEGRMG